MAILDAGSVTVFFLQTRRMLHMEFDYNYQFSVLKGKTGSTKIVSEDERS